MESRRDRTIMLSKGRLDGSRGIPVLQVGGAWAAYDTPLAAAGAEARR